MFEKYSGSHMKLLIGCTQFAHGGGTERYVRDLVAGFASLYPNDDSTQHVYVLYHKIENSLPEASRATTIRSKNYFFTKKIRSLLFAKEIEKIKKNKNIDFSISCNSMSAADIVICGFTRKGEAIDRKLSKGFSLSTKLWLEKNAFDKSQFIIAHSNKMRNELIQHYAQNEEKIRLLYPPVNDIEFYAVSDNDRNELRKKLDFSDEKVIFVFPSTGHTRKGLKSLLDWFSTTNLPVTLYVAGNMVGKDIRNVKELGYRKDMADIYRAADFSILNSSYEPFGLVGVESVMCGTPTLQSLNSGCIEILSDDACLKFEPDNLDQIGDCIQQAVSLKLNNKARLKEPYSHILYNPSLSEHIKGIISLSEKLTR